MHQSLLTHAIGIVSRFLPNPRKDNWEALKRMLRYLRGTSRVGLQFGGNQSMLDWYTNANMASDIDSRKSTSRYLMIFVGRVVSSKLRLKKCVALSITEACQEVLWLKKFIHELRLVQNSQSAIHLFNNSSFHSKTH